MSINTTGEQFKQQVIDTINQSNLPLGLVYYIMKDILRMVEATYSETLDSEKKDQDTKTDSDN